MVHIRRVMRWFMPFYKKITVDNIFAIAGQSAFFMILSSVPLLMFLMSLLQGLHIDPAYLNLLINHVGASETISAWLESLNQVYDPSVGMSVLTVIVTLWSAAKGIHAITNGLNRVHNTFENRNWFVLRLRAMLHTFAFMLIVVGSIGVIFLGNLINNLVSPYLGKLPGYIVFIYSMRHVIVFLYQVFLFALLYRNIPNLKREKRKEYGIRCQLPGALFSAASWHVLLAAISVYVTDFNGFSVYKGLTQLAVVMVFTYFCMVCLMLGAEINVFYHKEIDWFTNKFVPGFIKRRRVEKALKKSEYKY